MSDPAPVQQYPQLRMEIRRLAQRTAGPGELHPSPGYGLRTFRPGDEDAWLALLQSGDFGMWNRTRLKVMLAGEHVKVPPEGIFFVTVDDRPVGTASTYLHPRADGVAPELGWVVVAPEHRGQGLGLLVCQAVLAYIGRLGFDHAYLLTDDFRLPAIMTYVKLGFETALIDPGHLARWAAVYQQLGLPWIPPPSRREGGEGQ